MWFLNLPTGLLLIALSPFIPESTRFLQYMGRTADARAILARFGSVTVHRVPVREHLSDQRRSGAPTAWNVLGTSVALTLAALAWGFVNFGILLWLPSALVAEGRSVGVASTIIARSTLIAAPPVIVAAYLYSAWSTKWTVLAAIAITTLGLLALMLRGMGTFPLLSNPIVSLSLLIVGSSGVISTLLPYADVCLPVGIRGRA